MKVSSALVAGKIRRGVEELSEYDALVNAWSELCEQARRDEEGAVEFSEIESAAIAALSAPPNRAPAGNISHDVSRMLNSFNYPTFLVTSGGLVAASNVSAWKEFGLAAQSSIDELPLYIPGAEQISDLVRASMFRSDDSQDSTLVLRRASASDGDHQSTLAVTTSFGKITTALVFVVTSKWKAESLYLLKKQFKLTRAEIEVLYAIVDGYSSKEIAEQRHRSNETIRAQIQSIRDKIGAKNQTELVRTALSLSAFESELSEITEAVRHPHRRQAEILCKGGRRIELTLMGDYSGAPIVTLATATSYTFNAEVEQALYDQGLYMISICMPGCGKTDPPPPGTSRCDMRLTDVKAVLDQLEIERALMLAYHANSPLCYQMVNRMPERFYHLAHIAAPIPLGFITRINTQSSWVNGILKASVGNPAMKRLLFKGAMKALATLGAEKYLKLQLSSKPVEADIALRPDNIRETDHAIATATRAGIADAAEDIGLTFDDWSEEVARLPVGITIVQGIQDSLYTINNVRDFTREFAPKTTMIEVDNAGFPLLPTYPELVVGYLSNMVGQGTIDCLPGNVRSDVT